MQFDIAWLSNSTQTQLVKIINNEYCETMFGLKDNMKVVVNINEKIFEIGVLIGIIVPTYINNLDISNVNLIRQLIILQLSIIEDKIMYIFLNSVEIKDSNINIQLSLNKGGTKKRIYKKTKKYYKKYYTNKIRKTQKYFVNSRKKTKKNIIL